MCKRNAHRFGHDCPDDWELEAVLKIGEKSGWRRCYKCRTLVELTQGCTHMTCRCKAQFCYICGAVWDPIVGCPNYCNGEEELERRRIAEEARIAELEKEKKAREEAAAAEEAERLEAERRSANNSQFAILRLQQAEQMQKFRRFERRQRRAMRARHARKRQALVDKFADLVDKMRERHSKTEQHLEDRQVEAEIELRASLEQSEKSIRIQLRHMEAYCRGAGGVPEREITQKHREQLGRQYHLRDGMERRHQSQINVLREKQAKRMEELMDRQQAELDALTEKRSEEFEDLGLEFANEGEAVSRVFAARRTRLNHRWRLHVEILRKRLEKQDNISYGPIPLPTWSLSCSSSSSDDEDDEERELQMPKPPHIMHDQLIPVQTTSFQEVVGQQPVPVVS
jgi:hypothetical protein